MDSDEDSEETVSVNSEIEDSDETYELPLSYRNTVNGKRKYEGEEDDSSDIRISSGSEINDGEVNCSNDEMEDYDIGETNKSVSSERSYPLRTRRWSPKIKSVSHISHENADEKIKEEIDDLIQVDEDDIKQEKIYMNEDGDPLDCNDLRKSIFTEYPNLKINDEFKFTSCSIKLEKMDFSHLPAEPSSPSISETDADVSGNARRSRGRPRKKASKEGKTAPSESKEASEENEPIQLRSGRLKRTTPNVSKESSSKKRTKSSGGSGSRKRPSGRGRHASVARSDKLDAEVSSLMKSQKVQFMEAHGLTDRQESVPKSKLKANGNLKSSAKKKVSFADVNGHDSDAEEKTPAKKDRNYAAEYKEALAHYFAEVDTYKKELESYFECLCCDRKYATLEQCKVHVREHFPGMLTS